MTKKPPVLLLRIPRTGTTSLRHGLKAAGVQECSVKEQDPKAGFMTASHHTLQEIVDKRWLTRDALSCLPIFIAVRNPWERLVSLYSWFRQSTDEGLRQIATAYAPTFSSYVDWCTSGHREITQHERNFQCRPQTDWLTVDGLFVRMAMGRFERLEDLWVSLLQATGACRTHLLHRNTSMHEHYREYYTPEDREKVADFYSKEIELFEYTFD